MDHRTAVRLLQWYAACRRDLPWRQDPTPYRVWISEIMLQQTRVEAVKPYYARFLAALPTVEALAEVPEDRLLKLWEGLGYYSRARNLKKAAQTILKLGTFPDTAEALAELPGIGPYTAGAIASIAFDRPEPAVDGNVIRVVSRLTGRTVDREAAAMLLRPLYRPGQCSAFTQAWMELGATVCLPDGGPHCERCPLASECAALQEHRIAELPEKPPKKPRKIEEKWLFLLESGGEYALIRRPPRGVLAKLWGFPEIAGSAATVATAAEAAEKTWGGTVKTAEALGEARHIFTHLEWHMHLYRIVYTRRPPAAELCWKSAAAIRETCAIPSAYNSLLSRIK